MFKVEFGQFFRFEDGALIPIPNPEAEIPFVAVDSWLVEDSYSRSIDRHFERFAGWLADQVEAEELAQFFAAVRQAIPKTGRWFPRIEAHPTTPRLHLRLREAPSQLREAKLWTYAEPDPRLHPMIKGPDLQLCMQLRRRAQLNGADEAVLLDPEGYLCEGALSSVVWWREETLCAPNELTPWLPSITRDEVFSIAESMGYKTKTERVKPADLVGCEIWMLSSLQGIRPVTEWLGLDAPLGAVSKFASFEKRLRLLRSLIY